MKRFVISFGILSTAIAFNAQSIACNSNHGYTKTAYLVEKSNLSTEKKKALIQAITMSKSLHDQYTSELKFDEMQEAVQRLQSVKSKLPGNKN